MKPAYLKRKAERSLNFLLGDTLKMPSFETASNEKAEILGPLRRRCDMLKIAPSSLSHPLPGT